jgi:hypothetical protein
MMSGCSQQPAATATLIEDETYRATPASMTAKAEIVAGEITDMKVTERVEQGSGRVVSLVKLTGTLKLKKLAGYGTERLDPVHDATQSLEADVPAEVLKPKTLREIRLELA